MEPESTRLATHHRAKSVGAQSALGRKPATDEIIIPTLPHLADRVATRMRAKSRAGRTVTVRVRFTDLRAATRSATLPAAISATVILAEVAKVLVKDTLTDHPEEKEISLLAISVSHLEDDAVLQLELPFELDHEERQPGTARGAARWVLDRSVDSVRDKFGRESVGYGSVELGDRRSIPDGFRELAEKEL